MAGEVFCWVGVRMKVLWTGCRGSLPPLPIFPQRHCAAVCSTGRVDRHRPAGLASLRQERPPPLVSGCQSLPPGSGSRVDADTVIGRARASKCRQAECLLESRCRETPTVPRPWRMAASSGAQEPFGYARLELLMRQEGFNFVGAKLESLAE